MEITASAHPLWMAVVSRKNARDLGDRWETSGVYILLGSLVDGTWRVYVGRATDLRDRILQHRRSAGDGTFFVWNRALLVCRTDPAFGLGEIGWLEGRIHGLLEAGGVELENKQKPGDAPLGAVSPADLQIFVEVIQDALVLLGYDPEGRPQQVPARTAELEPEETKLATTGKPHRKLLDVVPVGTKIESTSPTYPATATVDVTGIRYKGDLYTSPSAAAKAAMGTEAADGYSFWGVKSESGVTSLKILRKILRDQTHQADPAAGDTNPAHDRRQMEREQRRRAVAPYGKMSAAVVNRLLARRDKGATYDQLQKEFNLGRGSVHTLLEMYGRVRKR